MTWLIYDLIILVVIALCVVIYARKGFMASLMGLLAFVLSLLGAYWLSKPLSPLIYNWFVRDGLYERIATGETGFFYNIVRSVMLGSLSTGDEALDAAAISVLRVLVFAVLVLLLYLVLKVLERVFKNANKTPLIGTVNKLLGGLLGGLFGILLSLVIVTVASILITASGDSLSWLNSQIIEQTKIFKLFYHFELLKLLFG